MEFDSEFAENMHELAKDLHEIGAIDDARMAEFDDLCRKPQPTDRGNPFADYEPDDYWLLTERLDLDINYVHDIAARRIDYAKLPANLIDGLAEWMGVHRNHLDHFLRTGE